MSTNKLPVLLLLFALSNQVGANPIQSSLEKYGFKEAAIPSGDNWIKANHSTDEYSVSKKEDLIIIGKNDSPPRNLIEYKTPEINYKGTNHGEWGGQLTAEWKSGKSKILIEDNIVEIIPIKNELYIFTGLAHLGLSRGAIHKITSIDKNPEVTRLTLLADEPRVVIPEADSKIQSFFIITSDGLMSYQPDFENIDIYAIDLFWSGLYPDSAVKSGDEIIIGMRSGIAVVKLGQLGTDIKYYISEKL